MENKLEKRVKEVMSKEVKLYEKANIGRVPFINFPDKKNLFLKKIAVWVLNKNGAVFDMKYFENKK